MSALSLYSVVALFVLAAIVAVMVTVFSRRNPWIGTRAGTDPRIDDLVRQTRELAARVDALAETQAALLHKIEEDRRR